MIVVGRACFMAPRDPAGQRQQRGAAEPRPLRQRECLFRRSNGGGFERAVKRLNSLVGLKRPPGTDARSARPYVLAPLRMILRLEPLIDALAGSPARQPPDPTRRLAPV